MCTAQVTRIDCSCCAMLIRTAQATRIDCSCCEVLIRTAQATRTALTFQGSIRYDAPVPPNTVQGVGKGMSGAEAVGSAAH
jgi:hypothetical protein